MSSQGPLYTATGTNDSSVGSTAWTNPTYIDAPSDYAFVSLTGYTTSQYLKGTNCGFTIPSGATIDGIVVKFRLACFSGSADISYVRINVGGTIVGNNLASGSVPGTFSDVTFGSSTELWGLTPTYSQINASNFGVNLAVSAGASGATVYCDYMQLTVYYTAAGGGGGGGGTGVYYDKGFATFRSIPVPQGAIINYACLRFTAINRDDTGTLNDITNSEDTVKVMILGHDVDDSSPPTSAADAESKARTDSCVNWDAISHWTNETTYDSPNIACIIQEIVDREGWTSGNDITLFVEDYASTETSLTRVERHAYDYGVSSSKAPQLLIWWQFNESASGGFLIGGTAPMTNGWTQSTSGGFLVGSTAPVTAGHTITATGGFVVGSTAVPSSGYTIATSGGFLLNSTAPIGFGYSVATSGGFKFGSPWQWVTVITIPAGSTETDLINFPAIFTLWLDPTHIADETDWATFDQSGNELDSELRRFDSETGQLSICTKVNIDHTQDCHVVLMYGA